MYVKAHARVQLWLAFPNCSVGTLSTLGLRVVCHWSGTHLLGYVAWPLRKLQESACLPSSPRTWITNPPLLGPGCCCCCCLVAAPLAIVVALWLFSYTGSGDWTHVLMLARQALYLLSHFSTPFSRSFFFFSQRRNAFSPFSSHYFYDTSAPRNFVKHGWIFLNASIINVNKVSGIKAEILCFIKTQGVDVKIFWL